MLKKIFIVSTVLLPTIAFASSRGQYSIIRKYDGETSINYDGTRYNPKLWYVSARVDLSFLSWENEYIAAISGTEKFNWKPVYGVDIAFGRKLNHFWRADLELGYMGQYSASETEQYSTLEHTTFDLRTFYTMLNAYYDFDSGVYFGFGAGATFVNTALNYSLVTDKVVKSNVSPMGGAMLGLLYELDEHLKLDLRYRFVAFSGSTLNMDDLGFKMKIGLITDSSFSIGVRYAF